MPSAHVYYNQLHQEQQQQRAMMHYPQQPQQYPPQHHNHYPSAVAPPSNNDYYQHQHQHTTYNNNNAMPPNYIKGHPQYNNNVMPSSHFGQKTYMPAAAAAAAGYHFQQQQQPSKHYPVPPMQQKQPQQQKQQQQQQQQQQATKDGGKNIYGIEAHKFVASLAAVLSEIADSGNYHPFDEQYQRITLFHNSAIPNVSVNKYLERIVKYSHCSEECYVLALIYLDRVVRQNPLFYISTFNIHRLLITSVMEAIKFFDDRYYDNAHYARVGGISLQELNRLEVEFLALIDYNLHVEPSEFEQYKRELILGGQALIENAAAAESLAAAAMATAAPLATPTHFSAAPPPHHRPSPQPAMNHRSASQYCPDSSVDTSDSSPMPVDDGEDYTSES